MPHTVELNKCAQRNCTSLRATELPGDLVRLPPEALLACQRAASACRLTVLPMGRGGGAGGGAVGGAGSCIACHARAAGARYRTGCSRGAGPRAVPGLLVARVPRISAVRAPHGDFTRGLVYPSAWCRLGVSSRPQLKGQAPGHGRPSMWHSSHVLAMCPW